jgi:AcrR family transcriptional regulator
MGRRSSLTPDQLKEVIVGATRSVIESKGLSGLSARKVARMIGYSPGTIYNVFANLDALLFEVEVRVLGDMRQRLEAAVAEGHCDDAHRRLIDAYVGFAEEYPLCWSLLFEHRTGRDVPVPVEFKEHVAAIVGLFETVYRSRAEAPGAGRRMFAALNGLIMLAISPKFELSPMPNLDLEARALSLQITRPAAANAAMS